MLDQQKHANQVNDPLVYKEPLDLCVTLIYNVHPGLQFHYVNAELLTVYINVTCRT